STGREEREQKKKRRISFCECTIVGWVEPMKYNHPVKGRWREARDKMVRMQQVSCRTMTEECVLWLQWWFADEFPELEILLDDPATHFLNGGNELEEKCVAFASDEEKHARVKELVKLFVPDSSLSRNSVLPRNAKMPY